MSVYGGVPRCLSSRVNATFLSTKFMILFVLLEV